MRSLAKIADVFPKRLFWDLDPNNLDIRADKDLIIPRALFSTTAQTFDQDIALLEQFYDQTEIVDELRHTKERISNKVCALVAARYHVASFARFK